METRKMVFILFKLLALHKHVKCIDSEEEKGRGVTNLGSKGKHENCLQITGLVFKKITLFHLLIWQRYFFFFKSTNLTL